MRHFLRFDLIPFAFLTFVVGGCGAEDSSTALAPPAAEAGVSAADSDPPDTPAPDAAPNPDEAGTQPPASDAQSDTQTPPPPGAPLFDAVASYTTTIAASGDPADVHYPNPPDLASGNYVFPIALLMQGAKVDKQHYSHFAGVVASYGFVVVIPNHESMSVTGSGLYMQPSVVNDVLSHMQSEQQTHPALTGKLDLGTLVLLGHSYGGVVGIQALQGICQFPFCMGGFDRPAALKAGAFYGTNQKPPFGAIPETDNTGWAVALIQGTEDQKALLADTVETYQKIKAPPKALVTMSGANHYGICNTNNPAGADADSGNQTLDQATANETAARWSALFLRANVLGDQAAAAYVNQTGDALDPVVVVESLP